MKTIWRYFSDFHKEVKHPLALYLSITIFITILTAFNYLFMDIRFEKWIDKLKPDSLPYLAHFVMFSFIFYSVVFLCYQFNTIPNLFKDKVFMAKSLFLLLILTVDVSFTAGSGTHTDWTVQISGPRGATGSLADVVDDLTPQLGGTLDGQSNDVESVTLKAVDDYYELIFGTLLSGEGDYDLTFSSAEAKTLTNFEIGSTAGGFTGTVKVAGADAGVSAVCSSSTDSDSTFTDASVAVGESLAVNVASITGSPTGCWARLHFRTDRVVNS